MKYISQKGQDKWIIETVFNKKHDGYFVDLAATDGITINNTYLLEKYFNWKGICIEANPIYYPLLQKNRSCITVNACVDDIEQQVLFRINNGGGSGIIDDDTDNNMTYRKNEIQIANNTGGTKKMITKPLSTILEEHNAPNVIDFLSLDVEGAETRILRNFPFNKYKFLAMCIERPTPELNNILFKNDYVFVQNSYPHPMDTFYVHKSIPNFNEIPKNPFEQLPRKNW